MESATFVLRFDMVIFYSQETPMWNSGQFRNSIGCWLSKLPWFCSLFRFIYSHLLSTATHCAKQTLHGFDLLELYLTQKDRWKKGDKTRTHKTCWRFSIRISFMRRLAKRECQQWAMALNTRKELKDNFHSFIVEEVYVNGHWRKAAF